MVELVIQRLRNTGFEDDIINEFIASFVDDNLNEPIYLIDFEGKKRCYRNHILSKRNDDNRVEFCRRRFRLQDSLMFNNNVEKAKKV